MDAPSRDMPERRRLSQIGRPASRRAKATQEGAMSILDGIAWYLTAASVFFALFSTLVFVDRGVDVNRESLELVIALAFVWPATVAVSLLVTCARVVVEARR